MIEQRMIEQRRRSREVAMELIFQMQFRPDETYRAMLQHYAESDLELLDDAYIHAVMDAVAEHGDRFDRQIAEHLVDWKLERLSRLERAILRLALAEIECIDEIDFRVTVSEAVELAKRFCDEKSGSFINGVLRNFDPKKPA